MQATDAALTGLRPNVCWGAIARSGRGQHVTAVGFARALEQFFR